MNIFMQKQKLYWKNTDN